MTSPPSRFDGERVSGLYSCYLYTEQMSGQARVNISTCLASPWQATLLQSPSLRATLYAHQPPSMGVRDFVTCASLMYTPHARHPLLSFRRTPNFPPSSAFKRRCPFRCWRVWCRWLVGHCDETNSNFLWQGFGVWKNFGILEFCLFKDFDFKLKFLDKSDI